MNIPRTDVIPRSPCGTEIAPGDNGEWQALPIIVDGMPVMYEDEGQEEMGESRPHTDSTDILLYGLKAFLAAQVRYQVLSNLDVFYHPTKRRACFSPDVMVVTPPTPLPDDLASYRIGKDGPPPVLVIEVLSKRTHQQGDLTKKPRLVANLGVSEYVLVDVTGVYLPQRLLLKQLQPNRTWSARQDADGGISSQFGFRVVVEADGHLRVIDAKTGKHYARPDEAQVMADRVHALEQELARLGSKVPKPIKGKGRRRKP